MYVFDWKYFITYRHLYFHPHMNYDIHDYKHISLSFIDIQQPAACDQIFNGLFLHTLSHVWFITNKFTYISDV